MDEIMDELEIFQAPGRGKKISLVRPIERIDITSDSPKPFATGLIRGARAILQESNVIIQLMNTGITQQHYTINSIYNDDYQSYFVIPFRIYGSQEFDLVFRARDFYLQGIITYENLEVEIRRYYAYFSDSTITSIEEVNDRYTRAITQVRSSSYQDLMRNHSESSPFTWMSITNSFYQMLTPSTASGLDFTRVIVATAETLRFREVGRMILSSINRHENDPYTWAHFRPIITNWDNTTREALAYLQNHGNLVNFAKNAIIQLFSITMALKISSCHSYSKNLSTSYSNSNEVCLAVPKFLEFSLKEDNSNLYYDHGWCNGEQARHVLDINLGKNVPIDFNKIEFRADNSEDIYSRSSWGRETYYGISINEVVKNRNLRDFILTGKYFEGDARIKPDTNLELIDIRKTYTGTAKMKIYSAISFYWENKKNEWHLQILTYLYGESWRSLHCGATWINYGNKIRLSK